MLRQRRAQIDSKQPLPDLPGQALYLARNDMLSTYKDLTDALRRCGRPDAWVSISYGSTETQGGFVECAPGSGYHNPAPDQFYIEVVDPETHTPLVDGDTRLLDLSASRTGRK